MVSTYVCKQTRPTSVQAFGGFTSAVSELATGLWAAHLQRDIDRESSFPLGADDDWVEVNRSKPAGMADGKIPQPDQERSERIDIRARPSARALKDRRPLDARDHVERIRM